MESPACQAELLPRKDFCLWGAQSLHVVERRLRFIQPVDGSPMAREDPRHVNCNQFGGESGGQRAGGWIFHPVPEREGSRRGVDGHSRSTLNGWLNFIATV